MSRRQLLARKDQNGQAIIIIALMIVALLAGIGLAIDGGVAYYQNTSAERAASFAALSGVIFMPDQLTPGSALPAGSGNDATDRAAAEARRNGYDTNSCTGTGPVVCTGPSNQLKITIEAVPGYANRLKVTVSRQVQTFFMGMFGTQFYTVQRSAIAAYMPPISLGQPGSQIGATLAELGNVANKQYVALIEGWGVDRENGDAFTPDPSYEYSTQAGCAAQCQPLTPTSTDVHAYSAVRSTDNVDPGLPARGGYNYKITLPAGGSIQVYNASHAPDNFSGSPNYCDNWQPAGNNGRCSIRGNYQLREALFVSQSNKTNYAAIEYTVFKVQNQFIRSSDVEVSQMKVRPIDASNWAAATNQYLNVNTNLPITQLWNVGGSPANMSVYHSWIDVSTYVGAGDGGLVSYTAARGPLVGSLAAGTYRLRVDALNYDGTLPSGAPGSRAAATHMYAVRALDAFGNPCAACTVSGWKEMGIYTPITGASFQMPLFQVAPDYAGLTVGIDIYDPGDISGAGDVQMRILDPAGAVATSPQGVRIYDLGTARSTVPGPGNLISSGGNTVASFAATTGGVHPYNGHWVHIELPIPNTYNPGLNPSNWWWSIDYAISGSAQATDVVTVAISLKGNPARLLSS
jgi:hypothetical protein